MYLIAIGWLYVALMMALAEATNTNGSILGAIFTFLLYGILPAALLMYILGTPQRRRQRRAQEAAAQVPQADLQGRQGTHRGAGQGSDQESGQGSVTPSKQASDQPDARGEASADSITPVREKP